MDTDDSPPKLAIGLFRWSLVCFHLPRLDLFWPDRLNAILPVLAGYSTYAWAKKYDAYLNSKEGHIAHAGEH